MANLDQGFFLLCLEQHIQNNTTDNITPGGKKIIILLIKYLKINIHLKTCMTFTLLKYFEDRTQTDSFDSLSISATLNSTKLAFFIKQCETGFSV